MSIIHSRNLQPLRTTGEPIPPHRTHPSDNEITAPLRKKPLPVVTQRAREQLVEQQPLPSPQDPRGAIAHEPARASHGGIQPGGSGATSVWASRLGCHPAVQGITTRSATAYRVAPLLVQNMTKAVDRFLVSWDEQGRYIPENIDAQGNVLNHRLTALTQSRHLYGLAQGYLATGSSLYAHKATQLADSFLRNFVADTADGRHVPPFFHEQVEMIGATATPVESSVLTANQQAYGLAGLVALYKATEDPALLARIRTLHQAFVQRFHDDVQGGFFDHAAVAGARPDTFKSYNSMLYVACAYLKDLAEVDRGAGAPDYSRLLNEIATIVADRFLDPRTGFIIENFDANWKPAWRDWQQQGPFTIGIVGHNMQTAWFLLRMHESTGNNRYREASVSIMNSMLERGYDWNHGGFYNAAKREEQDPSQRWMWGTSKAWWQQAEGMQALMLADKLGVLKEVRCQQGTGSTALWGAIAFWRHFARPEGGEYKEVEENGKAIDGNLGEFGKATYHVSQLAQVAMETGGISPGMEG